MISLLSSLFLMTTPLPSVDPKSDLNDLHPSQIRSSQTTGHQYVTSLSRASDSRSSNRIYVDPRIQILPQSAVRRTESWHEFYLSQPIPDPSMPIDTTPYLFGFTAVFFISFIYMIAFGSLSGAYWACASFLALRLFSPLEPSFASPCER